MLHITGFDGFVFDAHIDMRGIGPLGRRTRRRDFGLVERTLQRRDRP
jgi:hypothetical protein